jgi:hypothetical protein
MFTVYSIQHHGDEFHRKGRKDGGGQERFLVAFAARSI